jgi:hypothetical protein
MTIYPTKFFALLSILLTISACSNDKNDHEGKNFKLEGTIFRDCANTIPYKNGKLIVTNEYFIEAEDPGQESITEITTDENGKFTFEYKAHYSDELNLKSDTGDISVYLPSYRNSNLGSINLFQKNAQIFVKIKTNKVFTAQDNLMIEALDLKINGPFYDGQIIDTIDGHLNLAWENNKCIIPYGFYYHLNYRAKLVEYKFQPCIGLQILNLDIDGN